MMPLPRDITVLSMYDAIQEDVELGALTQGYARHQVPTPEWIGDRQLPLDRRIRDLRIASKQPADKQISAWQEELASLETALNA